LDEAILVFKSIGLSMMVLLSSLYIGGSRVGGLKWVLVVAVFNAGYLISARIVRSSDFAKGIQAGSLVRNALIVGTGEVAKELAKHLENNPNLGYVIKGFLDDHGNHPRLLGRHADLYDIVQTHFIDEVFITTPMNRELIKKLTLEAPKYHVNVSVVPDLYDGIGWYTPLGRIGHFPVMVLHREEAHSFQLFVKRVIDITVSAFGLVFLGPIMLAIALFIRFDSSGPILYRARRIGKKGMEFDCLKFRTMQPDADKLLPQLAHLNEREGPLFKMSNDPRITAFGHFLRRYSIDELPQLLNVLRGEMSLVGPRPPELQEYLQYQVEHLRKLEVKPGITGLWQISARQDSSFESYIKFDLEYIENWSVWMDLRIMLRTIPVVLSGTGV
jgi:exopolysaccharide biosynthesis polyprenyl glycosylphosphotransferase